MGSSRFLHLPVRHHRCMHDMDSLAPRGPIRASAAVSRRSKRCWCFRVLLLLCGGTHALIRIRFAPSSCTKYAVYYMIFLSVSVDCCLLVPGSRASMSASQTRCSEAIRARRGQYCFLVPFLCVSGPRFRWDLQGFCIYRCVVIGVCTAWTWMRNWLL